MSGIICRRCNSAALVKGFISLRCPICGDYFYLPDAGIKELWSEHRLGLLYARGGWKLLGVTEPPGWFLEEVV